MITDFLKMRVTDAVLLIHFVENCFYVMNVINASRLLVILKIYFDFMFHEFQKNNPT